MSKFLSLLRSNLRSPAGPFRSRFMSTQIPYPEVRNNDYCVSEINIEGLPKIGDRISGRLWQSSQSSKPQIPVILIHGWLDNSATFDPLLDLLTKVTPDHYTFLAIDLPGHGFSTSQSQNTANSSQCSLFFDPFMEMNVLIHRILRHYGWEKAILCSHSLGALLSFVFTAVFPEKVHSLITLDNLHPIPSSDYIGDTRYTMKVLFDVESKLKKGLSPPQYTSEQMLSKLMKARKGTITEEGCKTLLTRGSIPVKGQVDQYIWSHDIRTTVPTVLGKFNLEQCRNFAKEIKCPVCVIKGEPGQEYMPRDDFMEMFDLLKVDNNNLVEFNSVNGSHHFHLNTPNLVVPIISKFLNSTT